MQKSILAAAVAISATAGLTAWATLGDPFGRKTEMKFAKADVFCTSLKMALTGCLLSGASGAPDPDGIPACIGAGYDSRVKHDAEQLRAALGTDYISRPFVDSAASEYEAAKQMLPTIAASHVGGLAATAINDIDASCRSLRESLPDYR